MSGSASLPPADPSPAYRVRDLSGCVVVARDGSVLGRLTDVWPSGGNDIWVVHDGGKEVLIPALKTVVLNIDLLNRRIVVDLPPGLREIYEK